MRPEKRCHTRHRLRLTDGREIEVVYLDRAAEQTAAPRDEQACDLHVCFHCASDLVHPVDWADEGGGSWRILLRCPNCEATREGVFARERVERLEDELDRSIGSLLGDLRRMTHTNMSEEIEFFVKALEADVIVPSDF